MSELKKIGANSAWMLLGYAYRAVAAFVSSVIVARYLGADLYGELNYIFSFIALFSIFSWGSVAPILRREFVAKPDSQGTYLGTALVLRLLGGALAFMFLIPTVLLSEASHADRVLIWLYSISIFFMVFSISQVLLETHLKSKYVTFSEIIQLSLFLVAKLLFIHLKLPLGYFVAIQSIEVLIKSVFQFYWLKKLRLLPRLSFSREVFNFLTKESWPLLLSSGAVMIYQKVDVVMLRNMTSANQVGQYSLAAKISGMMIFVPQILHNSLFPAIARAKLLSDHVLNIKTTRFFSLMFWGMSGLAIALLLLIRSPFDWFYGDEFSDALPILNILVWKNVLMGLGLVAGAWIINMGTQRFAPIRSIASMLINIALNWMLIPVFGGIGAAFASLFAVFFNVIIVSLIIPPYRKVVRLMIQGVLLRPIWGDRGNHGNEPGGEL